MSATALPREELAAAARYIYLDHAAQAPLPQCSADAVAAAARVSSEYGSTAIDRRAERVEEVRRSAAQLLGVDALDVAFIKNTTEGLGFVSNGLPWQPGDRVVVPELDYPSTIYPWLALRDRGVEVDLVRPVGAACALPLDSFEAALRAGQGRVRVVATSWVQFGRGWRTDLVALADLCHAHGALLCVDAIQGLGVLPAALADWGVDFAMADGRKWMLGPEGVGVLYVAAEQRDRLRVLEPGWASVVDRDADNPPLIFDASARRFEGGASNVLGVMGLGASLDLLLDAGLDKVWSHVDGLCDRLVDGLCELGATVVSDRSASGRSAIVCFVVDGVDAVGLNRLLADQQVVTSFRGGAVRCSPHGWNNADDVDAALAAIRLALGR